MYFTDSSDQRAAAVLTEEYNNDGEMKEMPIACHSAFSVPNLSGVLLPRKAMQFTMPLRNGGTILKMLNSVEK